MKTNSKRGWAIVAVLWVLAAAAMFISGQPSIGAGALVLAITFMLISIAIDQRSKRAD